MDGGGPIQFEIQTPACDLAGHLSHALGLGLPEADASLKRLNLIANGPSAKDFPFGAVDCADTMALNGALKLFSDRGLAPTYWAACDPQELVAGFLRVCPVETVYLVASKCHPSVFRRLNGLDVRLWHVSDTPTSRRAVPASVSVTLCALLLAQRLGYRQIDVWGWDLSLAPDGSHHAATGELSLTSDIKMIEVGEGPDAEIFSSTPTWCCEVTDASKILPVLRWAGVEVVIHGVGMLAAIVPSYAAKKGISCSLSSSL